MPTKLDKTPNCSVARALGAVGERWSLLIIREAIMGSTRFDEFHVRLGIARNILQSRLRTLVENGVLERSFSSTNARIPHYVLTGKGWDLFPVVAALMHWGDQWLDNGAGAPVLLVDPSTDAAIPRVTLREREGDVLPPRLILLRAGPGATSRTRQRLG